MTLSLRRAINSAFVKLRTLGAGSGVLTWIGVCAFYSVITLLVTYPVAFRLTTSLAGYEARDPFQFSWLLWWTQKSLIELGTSPANLTYLFHPFGAYHPLLTAEPYLGYLSLPLLSLVSPVTAYNIHFLLSFVFTGIAMCWLCHRLTGSWTAALIGGLIFAFCPTRTVHAADQLPLSTSYLFPLLAWSTMALTWKPGFQNAVLFGVLLALSLLISLTHVAYFVVPFLAIWTLYALWTRKGRVWTPRHLRAIALGLLTCFLVVSPFLLPFALSRLSTGLGYLHKAGTVKFSADLLALLLPSPSHPILGRMEPLATWMGNAFSDAVLIENLVYLGIIPLLLASWGFWRRRSEVGFWVILASVTALLSLGPLLKIGGGPVVYTVEDKQSFIVMPYALIKDIPFLEWGRTPSRLNQTTMFALSVLASFGLATILNRWRSSALRAGSLLALSGLILFEFTVFWPFPIGGEIIPPIYELWAKEKEHYAVLDYPLRGAHRNATHYAMFYQMIHGHPIVSGRIYRDPPEAQRTIRFYEQLTTPGGDIFLSPSRPARLAGLGVRYAVAHKRFMEEPRRSTIRAFFEELFGKPIYEDEAIAAFLVPADEPDRRPLLSLGENWHSLEEAGGRPARWMTNEGTIWVRVLSGSSYRLEFAALAFHEPRHLEIYLDGLLVDNLLVSEPKRYSVDGLAIDSSSWHEILLAVPEGCAKPSALEASTDERCLSILFQDIALVPQP